MTAAFVQFWDSGDGSATSATTVATTVAPSAGNHLAVLTCWDATVSNKTLSGVSDGTNARTGSTAQVNMPLFAQNIQWSYFENIRSGITTITSTFSATADFRRQIVIELSGVSASGSLDGTGAGQNVAAGTSSTATDGVTSGTWTVTGTNSILLGCVGFFDTVPTIAHGTGFTTITDQTVAQNVALFLEYQVLSSSGSKAATFTQGSSQNVTVAGIAFTASAAAPTVIMPLSFFDYRPPSIDIQGY